VPFAPTRSGDLLRFAPMNVGRWFIWGTTALVMLALPLVFRQGFALTLMSSMGTMIIFALSYNMLLGQSGMLSFGHAVYSGLGAYVAVHTLNLIGKGQIPLPVPLLPLVGGLAGAFFGVLFGYVTTKKSGTTFAMITLGIGEMVFASALMFPAFFGGEGGVSTNRVVQRPFLGITLGPSIQVYYLIALWCFLSMVLMYAWTATPLGRIANAVRDNPERVAFIGYDTQRVRYLTLILSAFFAGIAGALQCINFEIVTAENVSAARSGGPLIAAFVGGVGFFFGPIIGAVIFIFFVVALSDFTKAWQLYLGLFFVLMVMFAPGGIASLIALNLRVLEHGMLARLRWHYLWVLLAGAVTFAGFIAVVEMTYQLNDIAADGKGKVFGIAFDAQTFTPWLVAGTLLVAGGLALRSAWRGFRREWGGIEQTILDRGSA
jgi:branched-chain amino acid transport system permease protein